jgi:bifunctional NMN adenylyltransferase/nudix hydrolase
LKEKQTTVGVIVGRFQTPYLHQAHLDLLDHVKERHSKVIVVLGSSPALLTRNNPLDFLSRKQMIQQIDKNIIILNIKDHRSDHTWSATLDGLITDVLIPGDDVTLYGSRDSFLSHYHGRFPAKELLPSVYISGTQLREEARKNVIDDASFRAGVIWGVCNQYPRVISTVDIAIYNGNKLLLVRKPNEDKFRLPGGFCDPRSPNNEFDAKREALEETGLEIDDLRYIGSYNINDWRYKGTDKIRTSLFAAKRIFGAVKPADDVCEAKWVDGLPTTNDIVEEHHILINVLNTFSIDGEPIYARS